ncbi:hypothetical protein ABIE67_000547 [Streptomyces sp. V4I8]
MRSLTPMARAASAIESGCSRWERAQRSKASSVGSLCASAEEIVYAD